MGHSAAAMMGAGLAASFGMPALGQNTCSLRLAFAARGLRTIYPAFSIQGADEWAIIHIFDQLIDVPLGHFPNSMEEVQPNLAESWTMSPDAKTWTFKLRQGVK